VVALVALVVLNRTGFVGGSVRCVRAT